MHPPKKEGNTFQYMKKLVIILSIVALALVMIAFISNRPNNQPITLDVEEEEQPPFDFMAEYTEIEEPEEIEPIFLIQAAEESLLGAFTNLYTVDYSHVHDGYTDPVESDTNLLFWSNVTLHHVTLLTVRPDEASEHPIKYSIIDSFGQVEQLQQGEAFKIESYFSMGALPWSAISFVDPYGTTRYFLIHADGETGAFLLQEFSPE